MTRTTGMTVVNDLLAGVMDRADRVRFTRMETDSPGTRDEGWCRRLRFVLGDDEYSVRVSLEARLGHQHPGAADDRAKTANIEKFYISRVAAMIVAQKIPPGDARVHFHMMGTTPVLSDREVSVAVSAQSFINLATPAE